MSGPSTVEFALNGSVAGKPISTKMGLPFARFQEFNNDVQAFVLGGETKAVLNNIQVQIEEGSYLLRVVIPAGILSSLVTDAARLVQPDALADMDPKRAEVVLHWQERARMDSSLTYQVRSPDNAFPPVTVSATTAYRLEEKSLWVAVERYLVGEIQDWGGTKSVNVHLRLRNTNQNVIIAAGKDQIRDQQENLVFRRAVVHVKARENIKTGLLKDYRLMQFWPYKPQVEEAFLQQFFEKGRKAWADVPNAGTWVDELRGGTHV